jgi:FkbH-like protein
VIGYEPLGWLATAEDADGEIAALKAASTGEGRAPLATLRALAGRRLDPMQTQKLARQLARTMASEPELQGLTPIRLAWLSSSTVEHLVPLLQVAGLRWGLWLQIHVGAYGQYQQEALDIQSPLNAFRPQVVLFDIDPQSALPELTLSSPTTDVQQAIQRRTDELSGLWQAIHRRFSATVIQQTVPEIAEPLFGSFEARVAAAPATATAALNLALAERAASSGVLPFDLEALASRTGKDAWFAPARWHHAKQLVSPAMALVYTEHLARMLAAIRGLSRKCLVLDLDNTLWGGVVGDDGVEGIRLGQGSAVGEAFQSFQHHCRRLAERGVILAVCSKNDAAVAEAAFRDHPEMVLPRDLIASFVANWDDKATNLRRIARELNLGLDALVFFDDNPVERALVRRELPAVAVPEPPDDPALYARCLAQAGYFEAVAFTADDQERARQYRSNRARVEQQASATDLPGYLRSLDMVLEIAGCDGPNLARVAQLTNKTNQFNLTTRRYAESDLRALLADPNVIAQCHRLTDRFGDNGIISVVLARVDRQARCTIDTWLMSCRVLGRDVEGAVLNALAEECARRGVRELIGEFIPTAKNGMVKDHYPNLGFSPVAVDAQQPAGVTKWTLALDSFRPRPVLITVKGTKDNG